MVGRIMILMWWFCVWFFGVRFDVIGWFLLWLIVLIWLNGMFLVIKIFVIVFV